MQTALVLGAAGRFGAATAEAFVAAGWRVKGQVRPDTSGRLPSGVEPVEVDARDIAAMGLAGIGADVVVHALNPVYTRWNKEVMRLGEGAVAAAAANRAQLMLPGNVYNFGAGMPDRLTPKTRFHPTTEKGRLRVRLETMLAEAARRHGFQFTILRTGDVFGSGTGSWFDLVLAKELKDGVFTTPAGHAVPHAWAYLPDVAATLVKLAETRTHYGQVETFHFPGHTVSMDDWVAAVEQALGEPVEVKPMPWRMMRLLGLFSPMMRALVEMKYLWDVPHGIVDESLEPLIGEVPHTPFDTAVARSLSELGYTVVRR